MVTTPKTHTAVGFKHTQIFHQDLIGAKPGPDHEWEIMPMHSVRVTLSPVKAISATGGLTKGSCYYVSYVTDRGLIALVGNHERLFPMNAFVRERSPKVLAQFDQGAEPMSPAIEAALKALDIAIEESRTKGQLGSSRDQA